jgi:hypothetical protein
MRPIGGRVTVWQLIVVALLAWLLLGGLLLLILGVVIAWQEAVWRIDRWAYGRRQQRMKGLIP